MADLEQTVRDLRDHNKRLTEELHFERNLNNILENIRNNSLILMQNCKCSENEKLFKVIKQFNNIYTDLKTKQNLLKRFDRHKQDNGSSVVAKRPKQTPNNKTAKPADDRRQPVADHRTDDEHRPDRADANCGYSLITELLQLKSKNGSDTSPAFEVLEVKPQSHPCGQCSDTFQTQTELRMHVNAVHQRVVPSVPTQSQSSNSLHFGSIDFESETIGSNESETNLSGRAGAADRYMCMDCRQLFASKQALLSHQSDVHKMFVYTCDLCDYKTERKQTIGRHREAMHSEEKRYKCPVVGCDRWFKTNHNISAHKKKAHLIFP